jgi:hypothetical protein
MTNHQIPREQTGLAIIARCLRSDGSPEDLSTATNLEMKMRRPDGITQTKQASVTSGGADGRMQFVTQTGDLPVTGKYEYQAFYDKDGGPRRSVIGSFRVVDTLG